MKKRNLFIIILLLVVSLTGCSFRPRYHSEREVEKFVRRNYSNKYEIINMVEDEGSIDVDERNTYYEYVFSNEEETIQFSVISYTNRDSFFGTYNEQLIDNYDYVITEYRWAEIENILNQSSLQWDVKKEETDLSKYYSSVGEKTYELIIKLESEDEIKECGELIAKLDVFLDYIKFNSCLRDVRVDLKDENGEYQYLQIVSFSTDKSERLTAESVEALLKQK